MLRTAADAADESLLTAFLLTATAMIPTAWSVLQPFWSEPPKIAIIVSLIRTVIVPLLVWIPPTLAVLITVHLPAVTAQIATSQRGDWRYFFGASEGSLFFQALILTGLANIIFAMLLGLALSVFVVLPLLAIFKPLGAAESNMLRVKTKEDQAAATASIRMIALLIALIFAVPTLIIVGMNEASARSWPEAFVNAPRVFSDPQHYLGDLLWALGIVAIPVGVFFLIKIRLVQRPDVERRAAYGVNSVADHQEWLRSHDEEPGPIGTGLAEPATNEPGANEPGASEPNPATPNPNGPGLGPTDAGSAENPSRNESV